MASFADEIRETTRLLGGLNTALRAAAGGGAGAGAAGLLGGASIGSSGLSGFVAAAGPAGLAIAGATALASGISEGAKFFTPAANAYAVTGTGQGLASAVNTSLLNAVESTGVGGFALGISGVSAAREVSQRAGQRVSNVTEDLARYGIEVDESFRKRQVDVALQQERRVQSERAKVQALVGSTDVLEQSLPENGIGGKEVLSVLRSIESLLRSFGGGAR